MNTLTLRHSGGKILDALVEGGYTRTDDAELAPGQYRVTTTTVWVDDRKDTFDLDSADWHNIKTDVVEAEGLASTPEWKWTKAQRDLVAARTAEKVGFRRVQLHGRSRDSRPAMHLSPVPGYEIAFKGARLDSFGTIRLTAAGALPTDAGWTVFHGGSSSDVNGCYGGTATIVDYLIRTGPKAVAEREESREARQERREAEESARMAKRAAARQALAGIAARAEVTVEDLIRLVGEAK